MRLKLACSLTLFAFLFTEHAKRDAEANEVPAVDSSLYDTNLQYRMGVDLYSDLPKMFAAPLREISLHPEHDSLYEQEGFSSSFSELAPLLRLACNEWHGTQMRVFEVGTVRMLSLMLHCIVTVNLTFACFVSGLRRLGSPMCPGLGR